MKRRQKKEEINGESKLDFLTVVGRGRWGKGCSRMKNDEMEGRGLLITIVSIAVITS